MAFKQAELYYWDGSKWVQAVTHNGVNALADTRLLEMMGNPVKLGATLTNFAKDWTSSNAADQRGYLTNVFKDYMQILVREGETHQIIFAGRIYKIETSYDPQMGGSTIRLEAFDALAELRDYSSAGLKESRYRHFKMSSLGSGTGRSDVIKELIKDSIGSTVSGYITNSSSNINVTDYTGYNQRFNDSATDVATDDYIEPARTGHTTILDEIARLAAADPHTSADGDKDMGYNYYVDHNITIPKPASGNWTNNPPAHFNYYKRGTRPTAAPATNGVTIKFGAGAANQSATPEDTSNQTYLNNQKAQKIMLANYEFNKPSEELFSHALVTYDSQDQKKDKEHNLVTQSMEVLYVSSIANFENSSNDMFFKERDLFNHDNKPKGFRHPPALLQYKNASNVWTDTGAYVHMATAATSSAVTGSSTVRDYEAILIGYSDEYADVWDSHMAAMEAIGSAVELRLQLWLESSYTDGQSNVINSSSFATPSGSTPVQGFTTSPTCTFNASTTDVGKGRARKAYGINRPKRVSIANITGTEALRTSIMGNLYRMNMDLRRGKFSIMGPPYYSIDMEVRTSSSNNLTFRNISTGTAALDLTRFNIRDGFTIMNFGSDQTFADGNEVSHGQISNIMSASQVTTVWNTGTAPSVGSYVRVYVPIRAGDFIRVENSQEAIFGNHFITAVDYGERNGSVMTTFSTVGRNEDVALTSSEGIPHDALNIQIQKYAADNGFGWDASSIPFGQRAFELRGLTFERTDQNTISWTAHPEGAFIKVGSRWYSIVAGNTDARLAANNSQSPMSTTVPSGETTCPVYYIYWDPDESYSVLQVAPVGNALSANDYIHDGDNVIIAVARANPTPGKKAEFWLYGRTPGSMFELDFYKDDPTAFIGDSAMTAALQRKGTQPFTSNVVFENIGNTGSHPSGHHTLNIKGKNTDGSEGTNIDRVIKFADNHTATLASTTSLNLSPDENTNSGSIIWYIYFDLGANGVSESGGNYTNVAITATTDYALVNTDERGLLAIASVSTDYTQQVAFQTFGSKIGNINADNIAANTITANAMQAATISTIQSGTTATHVGLGNVDNMNAAAIRSGTTASDVGLSSFSGQTVTGIREGVTPIHVTDNMAGVTMTADGDIYSGSKSTYASNTSGWFIGFDQTQSTPANHPRINIGSGSSRLRWTGTTLEVVGQITLSDGTTEANIKNSAVDAAHVGLSAYSGNSPSGIVGSALAGNHTGNLNGLPISGTSGSRIHMTSTGINMYSGSTLKATMSGTGATFKVYGAGGGANSTERQANSALLLVNGGYVSYISAGSSASDTRYDAATHYFYNFGQPGFIDGLRDIDFTYTGDSYITVTDDLIINTSQSYDDIFFKIAGSTRLTIANSEIEVHEDLVPSASYDLGRYNDKWNRLYAIYVGSNTTRISHGYFTNVTEGDLILNNLDFPEGNDFDGTRGHWILQEGANDLFIKNEITGKKYKFKLEEV